MTAPWAFGRAARSWRPTASSRCRSACRTRAIRTSARSRPDRCSSGRAGARGFAPAALCRLRHRHPDGDDAGHRYRRAARRAGRRDRPHGRRRWSATRPCGSGRRPSGCASTAPPSRSRSSRPPAIGCPATSPATRPHKVEILGDGQQFVAYGVHPGHRPALRVARGRPAQPGAGRPARADSRAGRAHRGRRRRDAGQGRHRREPQRRHGRPAPCADLGRHLAPCATSPRPGACSTCCAASIRPGSTTTRGSRPPTA